MKQLLRVSDKRNPISFIGIDRNTCITNFTKVFGTESTIVVADNCNASTLSFLKDLGFTDIRESSVGKIESFLLAIKIATEEMQDEEIVYLCEDDFLHIRGSKEALENGIKKGLTKTGYISLYDSLEKYHKESKNPYITNNYEIVKLILTEYCHWKASISSKFVVATKVSTLKEDLDVIKKWIKNDKFDYVEASVELIVNKDREFLIPIPGMSTECCNLASPFIDWKIVAEEN